MTTQWEQYSLNNADYDVDQVVGAPVFWEAYNSSPDLAYKNPLALLLEIAHPDEILRVLRKPNAIILDVRPETEIIRDGHIQMNDRKQEARKIVYMPCAIPEECQLLEKSISSMIPDKSTPIVVHCTTGVCAAEAKIILRGQGYSEIVNAGRFRDLQVMIASQNGL